MTLHGHVIGRALAGRPRRAALVVVVVAAAAVAALAGGHSGSTTARAASTAAAPGFATSFQPELGLPAAKISLFGAAPQSGVPGEAWGIATTGDIPATSADGRQVSDAQTLLEHTDAGGWQVVPIPNDDNFDAVGAESGRVTPDGGVAAIGATRLLIRDPHSSAARESSPPQARGQSPNGVLNTGESLLDSHPQFGAETIPIAAVDPDSRATGAFIAPQGETAPFGILHYDGSNDTWTREPILDVSSDDSFRPEALACGPTTAQPEIDSPDNCFLLALDIGADGTPRLLVLRRVAAANDTQAAWAPENAGDQLLRAGAPADPSTTITPEPGGSQMLTVTTQGVWVDFQAKIGGTQTSITELLQAGGATNTSTAEPSVGPATPLGVWCYPMPATGSNSGCQQSLGDSLPATGYRSVAWPSASSADPAGTRIITGLPGSGTLELGGSGPFTRALGPGGGALGTSSGGAAFASPSEGWVAGSPRLSLFQTGPLAAQLYDATTTPGASPLSSDAVPFGAPLLAVTPAPGSTPGDPGAAALAVGVNGQVGRYRPGVGWQPEPLLNAAGVAQHPTLRGVAWPETGRAYAVGDDGAMWVWQASTGLWEPDPAKPFNFVGNLTAVAFSASNPALGYAVGKQGVLLQFGKTWTQAALPAPLQNVNFTSIAFAGNEAIATFRQAIGDTQSSAHEAGGVAVDDGSGWVVDGGAASVLNLRNPGDSVLSKVAALPDGGVVAAGPGVVIERDGPGDTWHLSTQPLPEAQNVSALAAYRDGGQLRALVSIDVGPLDPNVYTQFTPTGGISDAYAGDVTTPVGPGQPPVFLGADPIPDTGYLVRQTATGWSDVQHADLSPSGGANGANVDRPTRPDPIFGLLVSGDGAQGLAVGGVTGNDQGTLPLRTEQATAGIERFGPGAATASSGSGTVPVTTDPTQASFVVGGDAECANPCADQVNLGLSPDVALSHAVTEAGQIGGARGFLYTGGRLATGTAGLSADQVNREFGRFSQLLGAGGLPQVGVTTSPDVLAGGAPTSFDSVLYPFGPGSGTPAEPYYSFVSSGSSGPVMVIVLDYSTGRLDPDQVSWLTKQLQIARDAGEPSIVMGSATLSANLPDPAAGAPQPALDGSSVASILVNGGASAYLFDYPQANVATTVRAQGGGSIPAFGTGTLGYVQPPFGNQSDSLGSSAFLVVSVQSAKRNPATNVAPVTAQAIPNIGQLAIDAVDGTLLRRSQVALFQGLARRPPQGTSAATPQSNGTVTFLGPSPYDPIPNTCTGANCAFQIPEQYSFSSSHPDIANFVKHDSSSSNPRAVALSKQQLPIADSSSGILCGFNAGTTTVSLTAGPLTYSLPVTVQAGSVRYPCGTVPLTNPPAATKAASSGVPPLPPPHPVKIKPGGTKTTKPPKLQKVKHKPKSKPPTRTTPPAASTPPAQVSTPAAPRQPTPAAVIPPILAAHPPVKPPPVPKADNSVVPVRGAVPPPPPPAARPVPPSGTSQVPSQSNVAENVPMAEKERQEIAAVQKVSNEAVVYDHDSSLPIPGWSIALIVLAAAAGGAGLRSRRRDDDETPWAWAGRAPRTPGARARTWHRPPPAIQRSSRPR